MIAYRREIDGLRALAVVPVILFHAGFEGLRGGFIGVDVFFVISGYLITSIILSEKEAGVFHLSEFWERRARRILPVLFLVIAACIPAAFLLLDQFELHSFSKSVLAASLFYSNFHFWRDGGYFETAAEMKPLLHTWSLAVEEQYYIFFPILILLAWRFGKRGMVAMLSLIALGSFILCLWASQNKPGAAFFLLPTRIWELAVGALTAFYCFKNKLKTDHGLLGEALSIAGLLLIVVSFLTYSSAIAFPGFYALVPTLGAALLILFATSATRVGRFLSSSLMVGIGLVSYSAYLWHQPIFAFLRHVFEELSVMAMVLGVCSVFCLAFFSWKCIELPFRNRSIIPSARFSKLIVALGAGVIIIGLAGVKLFSSKANTGGEVALAQKLVGRSAVYVSNMDERLFVKSRIAFEKMNPDTLVVGSSRIMQVGGQVLGGTPLNLAVSGATLEDGIALLGLAYEKFQPKRVLIGGDPWLFNVESGKSISRSISDDYGATLAVIRGGHRLPLTGNDQRGHRSEGASQFYDFYRALNLSYNVLPTHDQYETRAKIMADGSRVYGLGYASKTQDRVMRRIDKTLDYSMKSYVFDTARRDDFESLVNYYKKKTEVVVVLSPYHPVAYDLMQKDRRVFLGIENSFVEMGKRLGIKVVGSYNPGVVGCEPFDFYDGMHPKASCMKKVLRSLSERPPGYGQVSSVLEKSQIPVSPESN